MIKKIIQVDEEIVLELPQQSDTTELYEIITQHSTYLEVWMTWSMSIQSLKDTERFIFDVSRYNEGGQKITYFIKKNKQLIGSVAFIRVHKEHDKAELAYWIHPHYQGQGIVKQGLKHLINMGFSSLSLHKMEAKIPADNERSKQLVLALGFEQEGLLRKDFKHKNNFVDLAVYGLLKTDWKEI